MTMPEFTTMQNCKLPDTVRELGKILAQVLDEDDWGVIEPFLSASDRSIFEAQQQAYAAAKKV